MIHRSRHLMRTSAALLSGWLLVGGGPLSAPPPASAAQQAAVFVCPMHPDVQSAVAGACPQCGMALVRTAAPAAPAYDVEIQTTPAAAIAGRPFHVRLTVREPKTKAPVTQFVEVHEKRFHMFVISEDLEHYSHVHPEQLADGSWAIDVTVPRPGCYKIYADFLPQGGSPQVITRDLITAGHTDDHASPAATLTPDPVLRETVGPLSVALTLPPSGLVAGREVTLTYRITDAKTGAPITDLEPYLGAWGHSLLLSEDMTHVVHAHPVEHVPHAGPKTGGPTLTFKAVLPEPGTYRIWTQLQRGGSIETAVFTIAVDPASAE